MNNNNSIYKITIMGLLISIGIILSKFYALETPILKISFSFLPISFSGIILGPLLGGVTGAFIDILGVIIKPVGPYFPGFTISTFLTGFLYGFVFYKKPITFKKVVLITIINNIFINLMLNSVWISMLTGKAVELIILPRIIKNILMIPIASMTIYYCWVSFGERIFNTYHIIKGK